MSRVASLLTTAGLSIVLILSYAHVFSGESYLTSRYWFGIPETAVKCIIPLQLLAAAGFVYLVMSLFPGEPDETVPRWLRCAALPLIVVFLVASIVWPFAVRASLEHNSTVATALTVGSLLVVAATSLAFVVGAFQSAKSGMILASLALAIIVVLVDGIGWNARFLTDKMHGS